ncbi:NACHT domain-containing protein [Amycolatopsis sp. NPDC051128]|uniref:NACHT domain-containing protein n=1 Tax=Amycolatopsis sp. NPDC051128 TaxID=3155412 RepID=UPI00344197F0
MTAAFPAPRTSLSELLHTVPQVLRGEDRIHELVAELQTAQLVPAVFVPGIRHQNAAAIVAAGLPEVTYGRRTVHRRLDEYLFLDIEAGGGVRVTACWDDRADRVRMQNVNGWADVDLFLLRLRLFTRSQLPALERFLDEVGRHIADEMPTGWVQQRLRSGKAVVLVDGIDELLAERRPEVRAWLGELISAFPRARYVLTSRSAAVEPDWLDAEAFTEVALQPMTPRDVRTFVARWHAAMPSDGPSPTVVTT